MGQVYVIGGVGRDVRILSQLQALGLTVISAGEAASVESGAVLVLNNFCSSWPDMACIELKEAKARSALPWHNERPYLRRKKGR